jgi:hypothetical protein
MGFTITKRRRSVKIVLAAMSAFIAASIMFELSYARGTERTQDEVTRQAGSQSWEGTYSFSENPRRTVGIGAMISEHTIVIYKARDKFVVDVDADGYQTISRLRCDAKSSGNKVTLYFSSYREDNGFRPYKKGQALLSLERATIRGKTKILTYWLAYRPILGSLRNGRVYFTATKN